MHFSQKQPKIKLILPSILAPKIVGDNFLNFAKNGCTNAMVCSNLVNIDIAKNVRSLQIFGTNCGNYKLVCT